MTILVAYASKYGATQGIVEHIAEQLRKLGKPAEARSMDDIAAPGSYEAFVLGSGIYAGSWLVKGGQGVGAPPPGRLSAAPGVAVELGTAGS